MKDRTKHLIAVVAFTGWVVLFCPDRVISDSQKPQGKIAFVKGDFADQRDRKVWICNADGTEFLPFTEHEETPGEDSPAWSPDGRQIAFSALRGESKRIYVRNADGGNERCLTPDLLEWQGCEEPSWSPDGQWIACSVWETERKSSLILKMRTDGSQKRPLTHAGAYNWNPSWVANGEQIVFESTRDGNREIYIMDVDGSNITPLTQIEEVDHAPACSPDGMRIAFMSRRRLDIAEIFVMNIDGTNPRNLTKTRSTRDSEPAWSPDGHWIVFTRHKNGRSPFPMDLWVMKSDGSMANNITNSPIGEENWGPSWGP